MRYSSTMAMTSRKGLTPLAGFFVRVLILFPLLLALWYVARDWVILPVRPLSLWALNTWVPGLVTAIEQAKGLLEFVSSIEQPQADGRVGIFSVTVNPLIYGYGLPLYAAMMVASHCEGAWWKILLGGLFLYLPQAWGVTFEVLLNIITQIGPQAAAKVGLFNWKRELVAFGYQLGALIFPVVWPTLLWVMFNRNFVYGVIFSGAIDDKPQDEIPVRHD